MYIRPHLDYGDIIYHNQLLDSIQYQVALIVTRCWKSTSAKKLYAEPVRETLSDRENIAGLVVTIKS